MTDPPRKKQRAKRPDPDTPNATIELETADLVSLATGGLVEGKAAKTRVLPREEQSVFVDLGDAPEPTAPKQALPARTDLTPAPRATTSGLRAPKRGLGLVVLVYVISAAALATSIYARWFA